MATYYRASKAEQEVENDGVQVKHYNGYWVAPVAAGILQGWNGTHRDGTSICDVVRGTGDGERESNTIRLLRVQVNVELKWASSNDSSTGLLATSYHVPDMEYRGVNVQVLLRKKPVIGAGGDAQEDGSVYPNQFQNNAASEFIATNLRVPLREADCDQNKNLILCNRAVKPKAESVIQHVDTATMPVDMTVIQRLRGHREVITFDIDCTAMEPFDYAPGVDTPYNQLLEINWYTETQDGVSTYVEPTLSYQMLITYIDQYKRAHH